MPILKPLLRWLVPALLTAVVTCPNVLAGAVFPPDVTSTAASALTDVTAVTGGDISYLGDSAVTARGVVYSITADNADPLIGGANVSQTLALGDPNTFGVFSVNLSGLNPATAYSFKAFATNTAGTTYGAVLTFTTLIKPTIIDPTSASIDDNSATLGGNVTDDGLSTITDRGVVISPTLANGDPVIGGANVTVWSTMGTTGTYTVNVTGLTPGTGYSFKAYATNAVGTSYTSVVTFNTHAVPSLAATPTSTAITTNSATLGGNVTSEGFTSITERGIVYSISSANDAPEIGGQNVTKVTTGAMPGIVLPSSIMFVPASLTGPFTIGVTGLANGTAYTFAAYAINSVGTTYSNLGRFETIAATPVLTTPTKTSIATDAVTTVSSARLGGNVTVPGSEIIERGVVYSVTGTNSNPTLGGSGVFSKLHANTAGTTGAFTVNVGSLLPYTSYTFKAYVKNSAGTVGYTAADVFTTPAVNPVVKSGATVSSVTSTSAQFGGNVTKTGGRALNEVGVVYSITTTNDNPELNGTGVSKVNAPAATGVFSIPATGLKPNTQYSFKAFAKTAAGASYSSVSIFTTLSDVPTVVMATKSSITINSAVLGGNVTKDGGLAITGRGIVYSLTSENSNPRIGGANVTRKTATASLGKFALPVGGLEIGKKYSFAAYATNSKGTAYTQVATFTTGSTAPTLATPSLDGIESTQATVGANVTKDNGSAIIERGLVFSLSAQNGNPTLGGAFVKKLTSAGTTGKFAISITGLDPAKKYSFAVFAKNSIGTTYSPVFAFTTSAKAPTIVAPYADMLAPTKAVLGGNITDKGGVDILKRGVVYSIRSKNTNPLIGGPNVYTVNITGGTGKFTVPVSGLLAATEYVFKAYATNSAGTSYTDKGTFTTLSTSPTVTRPSISSLGSSTVTLGGKVTSNGEKITERGVVYALSSQNDRPRLNGNKVRKVTVAPGDGSFSVLIAKLRPGTRYTFAAYAKNSLGVSYSPYDSFRTKNTVPVVNSPTVDELLAQSVILSARVASNGGLNIKERGVVFSSIDSMPSLGAPAVSKKSIPGSTGYFSVSVSGLLPNTKYYFRAYATNALGSSYSLVKSFTTTELPAKSLVSGFSALSPDLASGLTETYYTTGPDGLKYLTIVIQKSSGTESLPRVVEVSGNLTEWFSGSEHTTVLTDEAGILKVRDNTPVSAGVKRYIRLKP